MVGWVSVSSMLGLVNSLVWTTPSAARGGRVRPNEIHAVSQAVSVRVAHGVTLSSMFRATATRKFKAVPRQSVAALRLTKQPTPADACPKISYSCQLNVSDANTLFVNSKELTGATSALSFAK